ncbi:protein kinase family protein [Candidatus Woesearchaeota archaeon]|nr:protein kinase family protein [Candidatus Woesearchaeota archaeon]
MKLRKKKVTASKLESLIKKQGFQFNLEDLRSEFGDEIVILDKDRRIHPVAYKSKDINAMLKIPLDDDSQKKCENAYKVFKQMKDPSNLVRLIGNKPFKFGEKYGILMELGDADLWQCDLKDYSKNDLLSIIRQAAKGLGKMHFKGIVHRDIKPSNIIAYEKYEEWALGDYGTASTQESTKSKKNAEIFQSPEFRLNKTKGIFNYNYQEDIFQLGVTYYMVLSEEEEGFDKGWQKEGGDFKTYLNSTIEEMDRGKEEKYFLKRLCGEKAPDSNKIPKGKTLEDYRYTHISQFVEEVKRYLKKGTIKKSVVKKTKLPKPSVKKEVKTRVVGKKKYDIHKPIPIVEDPAKHLDYQRFLKEHDNFLNGLGGAKTNNDGMWNTINHQTIDGLMKSYDNYLTWANKKNVKRVPQRDDLFKSGIDEYEIIRNHELKLLKPIEEQLSTKKKDEIEYFIKTIFLWGPPFTTPDKERNEDKGKARYSLNEVNEIYYIKKLNSM